jgi:hypothetical protein
VILLSATVYIKVRKELAELADKMIKLGLVKSKSHAFNIMIERGLKEVELWENMYRNVEELKKQNFVLRHGNLNKLLEEDRAQ